MSAERRASKDETIIDNEYCLLLIMVRVKVCENESGNLYFRPKRQERRILGVECENFCLNMIGMRAF